MARKDVLKYFYDVQSTYLEMLHDLNEIQVPTNKDKIDREQLKQMQDEVATIKVNYERLAYIVTLLNQPNKNSKKERAKRAQRKVLDYLDSVNATEDKVLDECNDVLKKFKQYIKEQKGEK